MCANQTYFIKLEYFVTSSCEIGFRPATLDFVV